MGQNVLGVLEPLDHFEVGGFHGAVERVRAPLALLVDVGHDLGLRAQHDLCVVLEVDLDHLVGQSEHDGVSRPHPLLYVHDVFDLALFLAVGILFCYVLWAVIALQVAPEMLKEGHFLLELLRVLREGILFADVLPVTRASLHVVEVVTVRVEHNLGGIVEEDARGLIRQVVAKAILRRVVNPFLHPDFRLPRLDEGLLLLPSGLGPLWLPLGESFVRIFANGAGSGLMPVQLLAAGHVVAGGPLGILELTDICLRWRAGQGRRWQQSWDVLPIVEPRMLQNFINCRTPCRIVVENPLNQVSRGA